MVVRADVSRQTEGAANGEKKKSRATFHDEKATSLCNVCASAVDFQK